jgi:phenylalanyl-tRNA synthetase beta chain
VSVLAPSWRADLRCEVDLIEEVARIHGYDKIGETTDMTVRAVTPDVGELARRRARALLAGQGFAEAMNYSLVAPTDLQLAQPWHDGRPLAVRNPISADRTHLRLTHMANLLGVKRFNAARGAARVQLFELGHVYLPRQEEQLPDEKLCLTLLTDAEDGLRQLKGVLANLMAELGIEASPDEEPGARGPFERAESVELRLDGELLGCAGMTAPGAADELDLDNRPALLEVDFGLLERSTTLAPAYRPVPPYPSTTRDLAVVVSEDVLWADVDDCLRRHAPETLESVELFDVYRGDPVPTGRKSVAFSMTFRRPDQTITAEEAEQAMGAILDGLRRELDAELR